jgi:hypothetical protein
VTVRVYVPASARLLGALKADGRLPGPLEACGVTPAVRAASADLDEEELEYAAFVEAARRSLRLLGAGPMRRVVVSADVAGAAPGEGFAGLLLADGLALAQVAAVHADEVAAEPAVEAARAGGPPDALDDHELLWFATQEVAELLAELSAGGRLSGGG